MEKSIHIIPLRKTFYRTARWKRTKRCISIIKEYCMKHFRSDNVIIGRYLNEKLWERGASNPPGKVKVVAVKDKDKISIELEGKFVEKQEEKKLTDKVKDVAGKVIPVKKDETVQKTPKPSKKEVKS